MADKHLTVITPAVCEGSGLVKFEHRLPGRYPDVGITEQHVVTFADGLACGGIEPVTAICSTSLQRAYDQLVHDVVLQNLPVSFATDRAGIVGADGPTHAGLYDLSFLRCASNTIIATSSDKNERRLLLSTRYQADPPFIIHYPRGTGTGAIVSDGLETVEVGKGIIRHEGKKIAVIAFGSMVAPPLVTTDKLNTTAAGTRFVKPIDEKLIVRLTRNHDYIVTAEESTEQGGVGSTMLEVLTKHGTCKPILLLGAEDEVIKYGDPRRLLADLGLNTEAVEKCAAGWIETV